MEQSLNKGLHLGSFQGRNFFFVRSTNTWKYIFVMIGYLGLIRAVIITSHLLSVTSPFVLSSFSFLSLSTLLPSASQKGQNAAP